MKDKDLERKIEIQKEHYADVPKEPAHEDKRATSNHYYKIEQIEKEFSEHLILGDLKRKYNIMEIGVGTGIHARHFLDTYAGKINKFVACDLSEGMLNAAKTRLNKYRDITEFHQAPAEKADFNVKFDGVYISGAMHHFASPDKAISKIKNNLSPEGLLVICEPNVWNPYNFLRALRQTKEEAGQFTTARKDQIRKYLKKADFDIVEEKVLHYRGGSNLLEKIWPYEMLNKSRLFNLLSVMFLFAAKKKR